MNIQLGGDLEQFVRSKVQSGQFASEQDVIADALRLMQESDEIPDSDLDSLRAEIQRGIDQLDRGEGKPWNHEEAKARLHQRISEQRRVS